MAFIYHRVPEGMNGTILYPLNVLKEKHPELFAAREEHHEHPSKVLEDSIPRLGCYWNDVLHFTALHPSQIGETVRTLGYDLPLKYFEVDATRLDPAQTMVFLNKPREPGTHAKFSDFVRYDPAKVEEWACVQEEMMVHEEKSMPTADEFLLNYHAPYILYRGELDVTGAKVIEA